MIFRILEHKTQEGCYGTFMDGEIYYGQTPDLMGKDTTMDALRDALKNQPVALEQLEHYRLKTVIVKILE